MTHVNDLVALVIDPKHPKFNKIGKVESHDMCDQGIITIKYSSLDKEDFYDGLMKGDPPSKIKTFYRHNDKDGKKYDLQDGGPEALKKTYLKQLGISICVFTHMYLTPLNKQYKKLFDESLL